jgi:hypothetical protein
MAITCHVTAQHSEAAAVDEVIDGLLEDINLEKSPSSMANLVRSCSSLLLLNVCGHPLSGALKPAAQFCRKTDVGQNFTCWRQFDLTGVSGCVIIEHVWALNGGPSAWRAPGDPAVIRSCRVRRCA